MADYAKIFSSKTFTFVIGPEKKEFLVHEAALSTISKPLDRLLNGSMKEAQEGRVIWDDLDESTFLRFVKWAYTGDYDIPSPGLSTTKTKDTTGFSVSLLASATSIPSTTDTSKPCVKCNSKQVWRDSLICSACRVSFTCAYCTSCHEYKHQKCGLCHVKSLPGWKPQKAQACKDFAESKQYPSRTPTSTPRTNTKGCEEYNGIFIAHAGLYILADKYDIQVLRKMTLYNLWATLKDFTLYPGRASDVANLIAHAFEAFSAAAVDDALCNMLADYAACIFEELIECPEWKMMLELPVMTGCVMARIAKRLG
ncbi:hypothetical protein F4778DRAFT_685516 [Xylariomycetidae sp. FL2044]|nr:hypothetical protein F4778DRAFT_685516 [Xylariomycetidae sp. FL2044]